MNIKPTRPPIISILCYSLSIVVQALTSAYVQNNSVKISLMSLANALSFISIILKTNKNTTSTEQVSSVANNDPFDIQAVDAIDNALNPINELQVQSTVGLDQDTVLASDHIDINNPV